MACPSRVDGKYSVVTARPYCPNAVAPYWSAINITGTMPDTNAIRFATDVENANLWIDLAMGTSPIRHKGIRISPSPRCSHASLLIELDNVLIIKPARLGSTNAPKSVEAT